MNERNRTRLDGYAVDQLRHLQGEIVRIRDELSEDCPAHQVLAAVEMGIDEGTPNEPGAVADDWLRDTVIRTDGPQTDSDEWC